MNLYWTLHRDRKGEYRVRAKARNGRIVFASSEGYKRKGRAVENAVLFGGPWLLKYSALNTSHSTRVRSC